MLSKSIGIKFRANDPPQAAIEMAVSLISQADMTVTVNFRSEGKVMVLFENTGSLHIHLMIMPEN